ncbi:MAG: molybdate ABC transporter substrate-binding protein [Planctomycetota bacterium]
MSSTLSQIVCSLFLILFISCSPEPSKSSSTQTTQTPPATLTVAVAANMQFAMEEIKVLFEKKFNIPLNLVFSSSGKITTQIINGAPYDLFLSADMKYPETLQKEGFADAPKVYVHGVLIVWTVDENIDFANDLNSLLEEKIQKIAIANPTHAPYGIAAIEVLKAKNLYDQVQSKIVMGESISQVNQYVTMKTVAAGFTTKSVLFSPEVTEKGKFIEIDPSLYTPILQGVSMLKYGKTQHAQETQQLYQFLFEKESTDILEKYGYQIPDHLKKNH